MIKDAEYHYQDQYYKVGTHGFIYRWDGNKWLKSTIDKKELDKDKKAKELQFKKQRKFFT